MRNLSKLLTLPDQITNFEKSYLSRMNRIAMFVTLGHLPLIGFIAFMCGTGIIQALVYTSLVAAVPLAAFKVFDNPRHVSTVFGFTSMNLSALMIHFGQGHMQIEMHFHVFVFIALLAVFANPFPILTAAVTVAAHHLIFYFFLPKSVFNYEASLWVVVVHALFVVAESIAAGFIARSFFYNVIGLEKIVEARTLQVAERNADMRLILDNASQGFVTISIEGKLSLEHSKSLDKFFPNFKEGGMFWDFVKPGDSSFAAAFQLGLEALVENFMPRDICLSQLPSKVVRDDRTYSIEYRPILNGNDVQKLLVVISDCTEAERQKRSEMEQKQTLRIFESIMRDKAGFVEFIRETEDQLHSLKAVQKETTLVTAKRVIHTIKGNSSVFGLEGIAQLCHHIESGMEDSGEMFSDADLLSLTDSWSKLMEQVRTLIGEKKGKFIEVSEVEFQKVQLSLKTLEPHHNILREMDDWQLEPARVRLERIADQARGLATRLGKPGVVFQIEDNNMRFDSLYWADLWSSFIHVIRNAIDHGLHDAESAKALNRKQQILLRTYQCSKHITIEISDNGVGINWEKLSSKALSQGLPAKSREDLVEALFTDGVSTKETVTEFSGRGVGMSAVRAATQKLHGEIEVQSEPNQGTKFVFRFAKPKGKLRDTSAA